MIIDLHIHTAPASACSSLNPDELVIEAKKIGLDGVCLTDHDRLVLGGVEITSMDGDILVFGLQEEIGGIVSLEKLREAVDSVEGIMLVSHPFRGAFIAGKEFTIPGLALTVEDACQEPIFQWVDGMEVLNGENSKLENDFAMEVCQKLHSLGVAGSDAHKTDEVGRCVTIFSQEIKNEEDLIRELKAGRFSPANHRT
jgi:histidinol phosphatase-like PHP family hydrolase